MTTVSYTIPGSGSGTGTGTPSIGDQGTIGDYGEHRGFRLTTAADVGPGNPVEHDLILVGGTLAVVNGDEATAQEIKTRLLFFKGEAFTNLLEGVPYFQEILRKGVDENRAKAIIKEAILSVPSIVDVRSITFNLDRAFRVASVSWEARTNTDTIITSEDFGPLVIAEENK